MPDSIIDNSVVERYAGLEGRDLIMSILRDYPGKTALVSSFGAESAVLLHMVSEVDTGLPIIFLDTGKLFQETLDYRDKLIRPVFPVDTIFRERASWLLKIGRYVARYGFEAAREVRAAAERDASNILDVPRDIWLKEMNKVLCGPMPARGLTFLADCRVLNFMLPEVAAMAEFSDDEGRHKDVWAHTRQVVQNAEASTVVRWAALCHDIGKVWTRQTFRDGKIHFFRHEDVSAMLFEGIAARFQFPADEAESRERGHQRFGVDAVVVVAVDECSIDVASEPAMGIGIDANHRNELIFSDLLAQASCRDLARGELAAQVVLLLVFWHPHRGRPTTAGEIGSDGIPVLAVIVAAVPIAARRCNLDRFAVQHLAQYCTGGGTRRAKVQHVGRDRRSSTRTASNREILCACPTGDALKGDLHPAHSGVRQNRNCYPGG